MTAPTVACPSCGTAISGGARFCANCGADLGTERDRTTGPVIEQPFAGGAPELEDPLLEKLRAATLGEYEVYGELGRGGMAAVYLAHDIALDRKVAIKVMLPDLVSGQGMIERFKREARTAGALSHPNIIPIFAVKEVEGMLYFVMKFVEGRGLDSIIRELGPLPLSMVQTVVSQVAGALAHAHRKNVVHRDVKPANVMIDEDGWAVVTDFGIAKVQDATRLTGTGAAIGTPHYMSPEQGSGKPVTGASDQYSLGIMAYEMLTGHTPFNGATMMEVLSGHFFTPPEPVHVKRPDCPEALEAVVLRMLAKDPKDRFPSLDDVISSIAAPTLAHDDPVRTQMVTLAKSTAHLRPRMSVPVSPAPPARRSVTQPPGAPARARARSAPAPARRRGSWLAVAVVLVVAGGAFGAWQLLGRHPAGPVAAGGTGPSVPAGTASGAGEHPAGSPATASPTTPVPAPPAGPASEAHAKRPAATAARSQRPQLSPAAIARARQDSMDRARADSLEQARQQAIAQARSDSLAQFRQLAIRQAREDSIARAESTARATRVATPAPAPVPDTAVVVLGTRTPGAVFYLNGTVQGVINGLKRLTLRPGSVRLSINAQGCTAWDTTITLRGGQTLSLGYRQPRCP